MSMIKFGTDGWRAVIAREFTFDNCQIVAQGIASYVTSQNLKRKGIIIGYDNRFMSREFAEECARVLLGNGIKVYLFSKPTPTPVTAFAVRYLEAGGAVMITASHNPPQYNGIKFIPSYAGPAMPDVTESIESEISRVIEGGKVYRLNLEEAQQLDLLKNAEIDQPYINHIYKIINTELFKERKLKVVVNPMFGVGIGYLDKMLTELGCEVKTINNYRDPLFGGSLPEPTNEMLTDLKRAVVNYEADLGLALDGDADRFGIVNNVGEFVSPNYFACLLLLHLINTRNFRGPVCRSVATTHLLDRIAQRNGIKVIETPVGFKYVGEALREKGGLLGIEESGGLSILGHIPEKDGLLAGMLAAEMLVGSDKNLDQLFQDLINNYGPVFSQRIDLRVNSIDKARINARIEEYQPKQIAGTKVDSWVQVNGNKFVLEDGSWVLIRSSGTEAVVRIYIETGDEKKLAAIKDETIEALHLNEI
ncbi:MAG: phosphoglucomutase/phosphomannomutase family protein [Syntrophomonadaceae bacterium]|jgi:alpha-D-glucose phosphate-specific phosphoglucomutase